MLSFRFHIVSLIAVFLALAIGIATGSTFVDRAIVDSLQDRVDAVSANLDARRAENQQLGDQIDGLEAYVGDSAPWLVQGRLEGRSVAVVAERGLPDEPVEAQVEVLRQAGAEVPGILWLEPSMALGEADERQAMAQLLDVEEDDPVALQDEALRRLTSEDPEEAGEALAALVDAGFVELDTAGGEGVDPAGLELAAGSIVLVTGQQSELTGSTFVARTAADLSSAGALVLVGEVYDAEDDGDDAPARGDALAPILDDADLRDQVATDDAIDLTHGRTAAVLALEELAAGRVSHVGYGEGADGPVPPFPGS